MGHGYAGLLGCLMFVFLSQPKASGFDTKPNLEIEGLGQISGILAEEREHRRADLGDVGLQGQDRGVPNASCAPSLRGAVLARSLTLALSLLALQLRDGGLLLIRL